MNKIDSQKEIEKFIQNRRVKKEVENAIREKILETHVKHHFLYGKKHDPVNHPKHYTSDPSGVECIEITRHRNFNIGNAIKYLWRAGLKDGNSDIQDLKKAVWYIQDEIKRLEKGND